jgi:hydrogenase nickel incorporation protein HypB
MEKALKLLPLADISLVIVENVGNLICPANFAIGTHKNIVIASVPEGDDKPLKYPGIFRGADVVILNKTDYLEYTQFDKHIFSNAVKAINPDVRILPLSCKNKSGVTEWITWIKQQTTSKAHAGVR